MINVLRIIILTINLKAIINNWYLFISEQWAWKYLSSTPNPKQNQIPVSWIWFTIAYAPVSKYSPSQLSSYSHASQYLSYQEHSIHQVDTNNSYRAQHNWIKWLWTYSLSDLIEHITMELLLLCLCIIATSISLLMSSSRFSLCMNWRAVGG